MQIEVVPIDSITPDPANVRTHSDRNLAAIKGSLRRFGQQRPLLVGTDNVIVAGNGTYAAARALGWTEVKIVRTDLKGAERVSYAIADNRTGDPEVGSVWDAQALADTLAALHAEDAEAALATGFTADEIAAMAGGAADGTEPDKAGGKEFDETCADDVKTVTCPKCGVEVPL